MERSCVDGGREVSSLWEEFSCVGLMAGADSFLWREVRGLISGVSGMESASNGDH